MSRSTFGWIAWVLAILFFAIAAFGMILGLSGGGNLLAMGLLFMTLSLRL